MPGVERYPGQVGDPGLEFRERRPERPHLAPSRYTLIFVVLEQHQGFHPEGVLVGCDQGMHSRGDIGMGVLPVAGMDLDDIRGDTKKIPDLKEHIPKSNHPLGVPPPQLRLHLPAVMVSPGYARVGMQEIPKRGGQACILPVELLDR